MAKHTFYGLLAATALTAALAAPAAAQPDLIPLLYSPMNATVGVRNIGTEASGPSHLTILCTKPPQAEGGCPDTPGMDAYFDPAYPDRAVIEVPALEPGETFNYDISIWDDIPWTPGTYVFEAEADAGNEVAESNEANNSTQSSYTQLPAVGVAPPSPLPLKAAGAAPSRPVRPSSMKKLILVQPEAPKPSRPQRLAPAKPVEPKRMQLQLPSK